MPVAAPAPFPAPLALPRHRWRRAAVLGAAVLVAGALSGSCQREHTTLRLDVRLQADGGATATVAGPAGLQVLIVANRPWRGDDLLYAGLLGARCATTATAADQAAGLGAQATGQLTDSPLVAPLTPQHLAALPAPTVFQAVAWPPHVDTPPLLVSNAWRLERAGGRMAIVPFTAGHQLADAAPSLLWFVLVPLALVGLLPIALRRRSPPRWLLPALVLGAGVARLVHVRDVWPFPGWPPPEELVALERHYGAGLQQIVATLRATRHPDERVVVLVDPARLVEHQSVAAQLVRLLPGAAVATAPQELPARGLVVVLATTDVAPPSDGPPPTPHAPRGTQLLATRLGTIWRLGGD